MTQEDNVIETSSEDVADLITEPMEDIQLSIFERLTLTSMATSAIIAENEEDQTVPSLREKIKHVDVVLRSIIAEIIIEQQKDCEGGV